MADEEEIQNELEWSCSRVKSCARPDILTWDMPDAFERSLTAKEKENLDAYRAEHKGRAWSLNQTCELWTTVSTEECKL